MTSRHSRRNEESIKSMCIMLMFVLYPFAIYNVHLQEIVDCIKCEKNRIRTRIVHVTVAGLLRKQ